MEKLRRTLFEGTLAGQIHLSLNDSGMIEDFKKFWLDTKVIAEIDYPIFFAVNQKPLKDESGNYRYIKGANGEFLMDEHGHPRIDSDLDEIAAAFVDHAKKLRLDFWRK